MDAVATSLTAEYGRGFGRRNLYYMMRFAEVFPDTELMHALRAQLSWTHLRELIAIDDSLKRQFYTELCRIERWSTRTLKDKMNGMLFERMAFAKRPVQVVEQTLGALLEQQRMSPDLVFRDPYVLDFRRRALRRVRARVAPAAGRRLGQDPLVGGRRRARGAHLLRA